MKSSTERPGSMNELLKRTIERRKAEMDRLVNASYEQTDAAWAEPEAECRRRMEKGAEAIIAELDRAFERRRNRRWERSLAAFALGGGFLVCLGRC